MLSKDIQLEHYCELFWSSWQIQARDQDEEGTRTNRQMHDMEEAKNIWVAQNIWFLPCGLKGNRNLDIFKIRWYEKLTGKTKLISFFPSLLLLYKKMRQIKNRNFTHRLLCWKFFLMRIRCHDTPPSNEIIL